MIGFGGYPGFGMTFSIMRIMVPVIFVLVFGIIIVAMVRGIGEWNKNNHSPKLSVPAKVVSRRTAISHHHHHQGNGMYHTHTATSYYATFQVASGDRMELHVGGREYGMLAEGDFGELTFQGTRYLGFARQGVGEPTPVEENEGKSAADNEKHRSWDPEL